VDVPDRAEADPLEGRDRRGVVGGRVDRQPVVATLLDQVPRQRAQRVGPEAPPLVALGQEHVQRAGWDFGVDMGSRDSATVGGMVATNAGGVNVVRYGVMRQQIVGSEAVLGDGSVIRRLPGLVKDNTGYALGSLMAGSEGTLAVITRLRLRLVPQLPRRTVALLAVDDAGHAAAFAAQLRRSLATLTAAELTSISVANAA